MLFNLILTVSIVCLAYVLLLQIVHAQDMRKLLLVLVKSVHVL